MTGSKLQLQFKGAENSYLTKNPEITFFKAVYRNIHNFGMQSIDLQFEDVKMLNYNKSTTYKLIFNKNGDLLNKIFFRINLPKITDNNYKWVPNIGEILIKRAKIIIGGQIIEGPILDRTREEPQYCAVPRVYRINSKYIMYYLGVNKWIGDYKSNDAIYEIRIATSNDGMNWKRNGTKALSLKNNEGGHYPFSVLKVENKYIGFYSARNKTSYRKNPKYAYKIFFAESEDGIHWKEKNKIKIKNLNNSFENVMQAYPSVLKINGEHVMFYNGNDFGKYGIEVCKKVI